MRSTTPQRGFTLIELIMVIVIMGVIGGMVAVFMKNPIDAYIASGRRAALTDVADTVVRRMARDLRKALPNSIRPFNSSLCIEFIPTKTGGRYRAEDATPSDGSGLNFAAADDSFNVLGSNNALPLDQRIVAGDLIAVYNLGPGMVDAYQQDNTASVVAPSPVDPASAAGETRLTINSTKTPASGKMLFPLASGGNRFHVIPSGEQVVSYVCTGVGTAAGEGTGMLYRYARSLASTDATFSTCPVPVAGATGTSVLAQNLSNCSFAYDTVAQRNAIVQVNLGQTRGDETVNLYHEIHVDNTP